MDEILIPQAEVITGKTANLKDLKTLYLADLDLVPSSKKTYQTALNSFFQFLSSEGIICPNRSDLLRFKENLCRHHTAKTVNLELSVVRSFFSWTQYNRIYPDIASGIKGVRIDRNPKRYDLSSAQISGILNNINTDSLSGAQKYAMVLLASSAGLRAGEISCLNVSDLLIVKDGPVLKIKGKGYCDKGQIVQIGKKADEVIRKALSLRDSFSPDDPLFISTSNFSYGKRISPKGIGKILKKILKDNNFNASFYTGHSFRHSACCLGLEVTGQNLLEVKKFMRHQNLETTMIYADHGEFLKNNIAEEIEKKLL